MIKKWLNFIAMIALLAFSLTNCATSNKLGMVDEEHPENNVHVFLHPKLILTGFKSNGAITKRSPINDEHESYDFYTAFGEQEVYLRANYTSGHYAFQSNSVPVDFNGDKSDVVFICARFKEVSSRNKGNIVRVVIKPQIVYLKKDDEKNQAVVKGKLNMNYFKQRCEIIYKAESETNSN